MALVLEIVGVLVVLVGVGFSLTRDRSDASEPATLESGQSHLRGRD